MNVTQPDEVERVINDAVRASELWAQSDSSQRARTLNAIADALDANAPELVALAQEETHLTTARLEVELRRTTFQLRFVADVVEEGGWRGVSIDHSDAGWGQGVPRPDLRTHFVPIGPVLVFAASNFPFAFSVVGGDTASALAAGNAVVVKGHRGHPRLSVATGRRVVEAMRTSGAPEGLFSLIFGTEAGVQALTAPGIRAAAFTGSTEGGRRLFDIACAREEPIPFFGELGSVNPVFVTRDAAETRATEIATAFIDAVAASGGQLCTKPGIIVVPAESALMESLRSTVLPPAPQLLNDSIADTFAQSRNTVAALEGVATIAENDSAGAASALLAVDIDRVLEQPRELMAEMFGPASLVVSYRDEERMTDLARRVDGQLTASVYAGEGDAIAAELVARLSVRAGRVLWNQMPTGVSVTWAQHHGGPYPATTLDNFTSVGASSLTRFLRPVAYQNMPEALLPAALRDANPLGVPRRVDGFYTSG